MKELNVYDTSIQNEALINELKGNLFEFLVGRELALSEGLESQFISSIPSHFLERLQGYENWLRENSPELLEILPRLAKETGPFIAKHLNQRLKGVLIVGKIAGGSHDQRLKEADLLLRTEEKVIPLSLKLCKANAYVNTKSAGVRSFFKTYFSSRFSQVKFMQEDLNKALDQRFMDLSLQLHKLAGLRPEKSFGDSWRRASLPELPGQLNKEMSSVLKSHYHQMIVSVWQVWQELFKTNKEAFFDSMMPLLGFGHRDIIQVNCFYKGPYLLDRNTIKFAANYRKKLDGSSLLLPKEGLSSFEVLMDDSSFQVRLKPMNKFTVSGLKVNCSLKELKT